jgi:hypothetical protein
VVATLRYFEPLIGTFSLYPVDQAIILGDPARPPALEAAFQRFRLPGALEGGAAAFADERVQSLEDLVVGRVPVKIIVPGVVRP